MAITVFENTKLVTVGSVAAISGLLVGALWYRKYLKNCPPTKWMKVGEVEELYIYPVKSLKGIKSSSFECTPLGAKLGHMRDRSFIVVDHEGKFVTGRNYPKMTQIVPKISGTTVTFSSPDVADEIEIDMGKIKGDKKKVKIWGIWAEGVDCGDEVSCWISKQILGQESGLRLLFCGLDGKGKDVNGTVMTYSKMVDVELDKEDGGFFADGVSYHLISNASIKELNSRLDGTSVQATNFRPNIIINGDQLIPFEEDNWNWLKVGDVMFRCLSPCTRCLFTTVDPNTGEKSEKMEPLTSLKRYRYIRDEAKRKIMSSPAMGLYLGLRSKGEISIGDFVYIPQI